MNAPLRLLIADDDPVMRMLLGAIARSDPGLELVAEAADADEAISLPPGHGRRGGGRLRGQGSATG